MKAIELRPRNFILDEIGLVQEVAYATYENVIGIILKNGGVQKYMDDPIISADIKNLKGIQLTEEWLLNFKFKKRDIIHKDKSISKNVFIKGKIHLRYINEDNYYLAALGQMRYLCDIKYVHQLQNLYYALTNEELTL